MNKSTKDILEIYKGNIQEAVSAAEEYKKLSFRYSMIRLAVFLLAIPALYFVIKTNILVFVAFLLLTIVIFVWAIINQQKYDKLLQEAEALRAINENEITAIEEHKNEYFDGESYQIPNHHYTEDLDVFGPHSIFALINRGRTFFGNQLLKKYFLLKPTIENVLRRQEAIEEMSENLEWRQEIATKLYDLSDVHDYNIAQAINNQMEMDLSFAENPFLNIYRRLLPLIWLGVFSLYFYNASLANTLFTTLFIGNLLLVGNFTKRVNEVQGRLANTNNSLKRYIEVLKTIFDKTWTSQLLQEHASQFDSESGNMPVKSLSSLSKIIDQLDYRLNFLVAIVGNGLILMDLGTVSKLAKWKNKNDGKLELLFRHIGFIEAISSLSSWAYNHPQYAFPNIEDNYMSMAAYKIEHPLIPVAQNVHNDFNLDPEHEVVIITGSNMSGKSTLLRTLGLNMILGYTGTKVAASNFSFPIVDIVTYMRIKDALEENVSTFKAELNRIEMILDLLKTKKNTFILIDEMLRGTNSKDKLNGSIGITKKLLDSDAYAMIATHDIKLAELGNTDSRIANYFFDIDYADGELVFDYKVKAGICENFNASFLLGQLGIDTDVGNNQQ